MTSRHRDRDGGSKRQSNHAVVNFHDISFVPFISGHSARIVGVVANSPYPGTRSTTSRAVVETVANERAPLPTPRSRQAGRPQSLRGGGRINGRDREGVQGRRLRSSTDLRLQGQQEGSILRETQVTTREWDERLPSASVLSSKNTIIGGVSAVSRRGVDRDASGPRKVAIRSA